MSQEFMRRFAKSYACQWCGKKCSVKGIKQHRRRCKKRPRGVPVGNGPWDN